MYDELLDLLRGLDGVRQDPRYHPEGDALFHTLQVFDHARRETDDRSMWGAALLHDVGKALGSPDHDASGADLLDGLVAARIVWLVGHHLDLLRAPGPTRRRHRHTDALADLERLRRWDLAGRNPHATVMPPETALAILLEDPTAIAPAGDDHDLENADR